MTDKQPEALRLAQPEQEPVAWMVYTPPPVVGGYRMGEVPGYFQFNLTKKPCWLHRLGVRLVLGWKWVDA